MSGHSKWAKVKRAKAVTDARKGKAFSRISRDITIAAKAGGGDPDMNPRLRTILMKAREANMPADNIDRAIKKGTGELPGIVYEEVLYEGYGPGGVAVIVQATTDNKNRAASAIRSIFTRYGGNLAGAGAVAFQFQHLGQFLIAKEKASEDELMELALEAGADDVLTTEQGCEIRCAIKAFDAVSHALEKKKITPDSAEIAYIPTSFVPVTDLHAAKSLVKLHEALEEDDDVQAVFSNEEMDEALTEAAQK
ncbi:MAG: YebC/PmpR family DNA-binding transcriptional regulator [Verrucomicrobiota bacterium]|nr:YebC/PmpR family DNA-binding transcriptional regulator [Verrucomicrobiota bacterium]